MLDAGPDKKKSPRLCAAYLGKDLWPMISLDSIMQPPPKRGHKKSHAKLLRQRDGEVIHLGHIKHALKDHWH